MFCPRLRKTSFGMRRRADPRASARVAEPNAAVGPPSLPTEDARSAALAARRTAPVRGWTHVVIASLSWLGLGFGEGVSGTVVGEGAGSDRGAAGGGCSVLAVVRGGW